MLLFFFKVRTEWLNNRQRSYVASMMGRGDLIRQMDIETKYRSTFGYLGSVCRVKLSAKSYHILALISMLYIIFKF